MTWIQTYTNKKFDYLNVEPESIDIIDIAHSLARICRYTGHIDNKIQENPDSFYSVAEHCVLMTEAIPYEYKKHALMHDAVEAYIGDINGPFKSLLGEHLRMWEIHIEKIIFKKFGLSWPVPSIVKEYDIRMLLNEKEVLMGPSPERWFVDDYDKVSNVNIQCWLPRRAEYEFLETFYILFGDD